jgi:hypothetical protein
MREADPANKEREDMERARSRAFFIMQTAWNTLGETLGNHPLGKARHT